MTSCAVDGHGCGPTAFCHVPNGVEAVHQKVGRKLYLDAITVSVFFHVCDVTSRINLDITSLSQWIITRDRCV